MSTKNLPQKPDWLVSRPISTSNYIGIGSATIKDNPNESLQLAKKNALNDLAGEISMNISNTSFLHQLAVNDVFNVTFDSRIQTTVNENIEGYQLIGTYQDQSNYWVYYSLSKETYRLLKQQQMQKALDNALSKFAMAMQYKHDFQYYNALLLFVKATEDIKQYLADPLITNYQNTEIYFGNLLFNEIVDCFNKLSIKPAIATMAVKRGQMIHNEKLTFTVRDRSGHPIENIPVIADYSGSGLIDNKARTDKKGKVSFCIPKIRSMSITETFEVKIDVSTLLNEATNDFRIKKILKNFRIETATIETTVLNPVFFIEATERSLGLPAVNGMKEMAKEMLVINDCDVTEESAEADYILTIVTDITTMEAANHNCKANFGAEVTVHNPFGKPLYQRNVSDIMAIEKNCESANSTALAKGKAYLKTRVIPDIFVQLF